MSRMVQIRNMPDAMHRLLKSRAALAGMSLSDYLISELRFSTDRVTPEELRERVSRRRPVKLPVSTARWIREERDSR